MSSEQGFWANRTRGLSAVVSRLEGQCCRYGSARRDLKRKMEALDAAEKDKRHIVSASLLLFATVVQVVAICTVHIRGVETWEAEACLGVELCFMLLTSGFLVYGSMLHRMRIEWTLMEHPELEPVRDKAMDDVSDIDRFLEGLLRNGKFEGRESE